MLTPSERALLFRACWNHAVATCAHCGRSFQWSELAADLVSGRSNLCPSCSTDLTDSIREHLVSCAASTVLMARDTRVDGKLIREGGVGA